MMIVEDWLNGEAVAQFGWGFTLFLAVLVVLAVAIVASPLLVAAVIAGRSRGE